MKLKSLLSKLLEEAKKRPRRGQEEAKRMPPRGDEGPPEALAEVDRATGKALGRGAPEGLLGITYNLCHLEVYLENS